MMPVLAYVIYTIASITENFKKIRVQFEWITCGGGWMEYLILVLFDHS